MNSVTRSRGQLRRLARDNADDMAKLLEVYQRENESLKNELAAAHAFIMAVVGYDYVDKGTGEVILAIGPKHEESNG
jgi:hypothetical protein